MRLRALLIVVVLGGCANQPPMNSDSSVVWTDVADQYVVVTLRNHAPVVARAGSTPRDYDTPLRYGVSATTRRQVAALAAAHRMREVDAWPIGVLGLHCIVFRLADDVPRATALRQLARDPRVESVQPLNVFRTLSSHDDPYRRLQHNLDTLQISQAHAWSRGENMRIAVVDTGIDAEHPDLKGRIALQRSFVAARDTTAGDRHGTAVAGVIAALDNNREGIVGIAPAASLVSLKACWEQDATRATAVCNTFTLAKALVAAVEADSHIVNLSLGGPADPLLERLIEHGLRRGIIYVGALSPTRRGFPCNILSVICVGRAGRWSDAAQLFAPGDEVLTLVPARRYDFVSGSSLAAASVSASIALLRARKRELSAPQALGLLAASSSRDGDPAPSINTCEALARLLGKPSCAAR